MAPREGLAAGRVIPVIPAIQVILAVMWALQATTAQTERSPSPLAQTLKLKFSKTSKFYSRAGFVVEIADRVRTDLLVYRSLPIWDGKRDLGRKKGQVKWKDVRPTLTKAAFAYAGSPSNVQR